VDEPFLFPKRTAPTAPRGPIAAGDRLLDHEVELGFVALAPIRPGTAPRFGLVLVGDYTDRAALLRELDIGDVASGRGFGTAKSFPGALPVGPLLVVPEDPQAFYRRLRLELFVNGRKRQQAEPHRMLWDLDRILVEMFRAPERRWLVAGHATGLGLEDGALPPGAILLSGTADGVIFRPPSTRQIALGIVGMAASLDWRWPGGMFEPAIREWRADRRYLQPGDVVVMRADFLGVIRNEVAP
jgi:2-keto-4-pentenoate hydratase/2-oxohepta-3-ene-1,7-dioic acid hydratase in catechol pathway